MRIAILGAGKIGATAARLFIEAGHDVAISNSRGPESLHGLIQQLGPRAQATTGENAARWGEIVLLAVPWSKPEALPPPTAVEGKIVIDAMNPYRENFALYDLGDSTSSEETAKRLPGARLVKAFNTIYYKHLDANGRKDLPVDDRHPIFLAGDDAAAKATVASLIEQIGFGPVDTGPLRQGGKRQEPNTSLYNQVITTREGKERLAAG